MKKMTIFFAILFCSSLIYSQQANLYDANYDMPEKALHYDDEMELFQKIYLQYESAIEAGVARVQKEEAEKYQEELQRLIVQFQKDQAATIEQARADIYASETEKVREQETERLTREITQEVTARLTAEFETKKNEELVILERDLRNKILNDRDAITERVKVIAPYAAMLLAGIIVIILIFVMVRARIRKNKIKANKERRIESAADMFFERLKEFKGNKTVLLEDINKKSGEDREIEEEGLKRAEEKYEKTKNLKSIKDYGTEFTSLRSKTEKIFSNWNMAGDDLELKNGLCNNFYNNIADYSKTGSELASSRRNRSENEKSEIHDLLANIAMYLDNVPKQIDSLLTRENEKFKTQLKNIQKSYKKLTVKFKTGDFK